MRSDTAAQTGATVILGMLMTAALLVLQPTGLSSGTGGVPGAGASDSYNVLRVPLNLADLLDGGGDEGRTPSREVATTEEIPVRPAVGPTVSALHSPTIDRRPNAAAAETASPARKPKPRSAPPPDRASAGPDRRGHPVDSDRRSALRKATKPTKPMKAGKAMTAATSTKSTRPLKAMKPDKPAKPLKAMKHSKPAKPLKVMKHSKPTKRLKVMKHSKPPRHDQRGSSGGHSRGRSRGRNTSRR